MTDDGVPQPGRETPGSEQAPHQPTPPRALWALPALAAPAELMWSLAAGRGGNRCQPARPAAQLCGDRQTDCANGPGPCPHVCHRKGDWQPALCRALSTRGCHALPPASALTITDSRNAAEAQWPRASTTPEWPGLPAGSEHDSSLIKPVTRGWEATEETAVCCWLRTRVSTPMAQLPARSCGVWVPGPF